MNKTQETEDFDCDLDKKTEVITATSNHDNSSEVKLPRRKSSVWVLVKKKMSVTEKGATPIQWKMVILVFVSLFGSAFSLTFLFPFLPEMVLWFGYEEEEKGYYAGLIASAVFFGRAVGSYFWGWLSDKFGRRPIILITVFLNGFFSLAFGFTFNFPMAMITRFLTGLANGTVGTAKTVIYEISDNTNQAVGMSILSMAWGAGLILGPTFGGLLADPVKSYPSVFGGSEFLEEFPYLLPGLLVFIVCTLVTIVEFFLLEETLHSKRGEIELTIEERKLNSIDINPDEDITILVDDEEDKKSIQSFSSQKIPKISMSVENLHLENEAAYFHAQYSALSNESLNRDKKHLNETDSLTEDQEHSTLLQDSGLKSRITNGHSGSSFVKRTNSLNGSCHSDPTRSLNGSAHFSSKNSIQSSPKNCCNGHEIVECSVKEITDKKTRNIFVRCCKVIGEMSLFRLLSQSDIRHPVLLYTIFSFAVIGYEEIFTVWCSTDPMLDGLGFNPGEIGTVLGLSAVPLLLLNAYVFPWCARKFGIKKTFLGGSMIMMVLTAIQPVAHLLHDRPSALWATLLVIILPLKVAVSCCFTATAIFINNSVEPSEAGAVNGIAMTATAIGRTLAPTVGGSVFAWSISYGAKHLGPPFDVSLSFFFMSLCCFITIVSAVTLPERLTRQKK
ncbi:Hypothetical predicted protein [Mytilus galloprovincialis]|uniref:Major facilitator superfamily (MFS) profile domain-containing protein n=1 Tax=Mytilus galloprovincialis TaxID=29158 RepID=A0A8B6HPV3_MYTGA|nr:Hypothetical predicted protein [Mytilus galloprovincialis]